MFKVILVAISLATGQPIGIGVSTTEYASEATCQADIISKSSELQAALKSRVPGGVKVEGKCAPSADADKLFEAAGPGA